MSLPSLELLNSEEVLQLFHELQVHQFELEIQNEELRASEASLDFFREKYFDLYDRAPVGYGTVSIDGVVLEANQTLSRLLGHAPGSLVQQPLSKYVLTEDQDTLYLLLKQLRQGHVVPATSIRFRRGPKDLFWAKIDATIVKDEAGEAVFRMVVIDSTQERIAEEALHLAGKLDSLESLAGGIAHDFNNLLGGIFGYIALARDFGKGDPRVVRSLEKASLVFDRAKSLTSQLLTFTKKNLPQRTRLALGPLVQKSAAFALAGTNVVARVSIDDDLLPAWVDENQIGQVLDNVILNAAQSMPQGGEVQIDVRNLTLEPLNGRSLAPGPFLEVTISDSGVGIPRALLERVFEPFFTTKSTGHGLGLATSHSIVVKHGGIIAAESVEGQGTTFRILLPATDLGTSEVLEAETTKHSGAGTVLIMDDEEFYRELLSTKIRGMGYRVVEAKDGDDALRLCQSEVSLRAAILDLTIKGGRGGKDTLPLLRARFPRLAVIAVSGFSEDPVIACPGDFGFTASLRKPFRPEELDALFEKHLGQ